MEFCIVGIVLTDHVQSYSIYLVRLKSPWGIQNACKTQPNRCIYHCHQDKWRQAENIYLNDLSKVEENGGQR